MGYSSKSNPVQILIAKLFKLHNNALLRNAESYVFYYKDVLDILNNPVIEQYIECKGTNKHHIKKTITLLLHTKN